MSEIDAEVEQSVLGAILLSGSTLKPLVLDEGLKPGHFAGLQAELAFSAMLSLSEQGEPIDLVTVTAQLKRDNLLTKVGEPYLDGLDAAMVPNIGNVRAYARRIVELARWRKIAEAGRMLAEAATLEDQGLVAQAEALMVPESQREASTTVSEDVYAYLNDEPVAWPLPYPRMNDLSNGGLRPSEQTLIGAWTNIGKTAILDSMLQHVADRNARVRLYINEGSRVQRALRMIARDTGIPYSRLRARTLRDGDHKRVLDALGAGLSVEIIQAADWSAGDIARDMRWNPRDVVAVDILHEIPYGDERDLARNWSTLKAASVTVGCHLIATVHLNEARSVGGEPPAPTLRDIRGSGMLKNGADNVLFVHREHETVDGHAQMTEEGAVWFAKSRHGEHGGVKVRFDAARMRFVERAAEEDRWAA